MVIRGHTLEFNDNSKTDVGFVVHMETRMCTEIIFNAPAISMGIVTYASLNYY